ncbi:MAG: hypothetical protein KatS3mg110_0487 [Pirellulaceae bacterium]|nr:MAG: hypothetical protein KatS3mg110_0487 [Pirellulaceae bacterium]
MPRRRNDIRPGDIQGLKYFKQLMPLLERLHAVGTERDKSGNRKLHYDQYVMLILLFLFNPVIDSLRGLQRAAGLTKVQKALGIIPVSLGSLSEAPNVFDPELLHQMIPELASRAMPITQGREAEALAGLTAVDGTILRALPRMAWAIWQDERHRGIKIHLHFEVLKGVPADVRVTPAACSEPDELRAMLQPGRLYVLDRGYANFALYRAILDAGSSFIGRVKDNTAFTVAEERTLRWSCSSAGLNA